MPQLNNEMELLLKELKDYILLEDGIDVDAECEDTYETDIEYAVYLQKEFGNINPFSRSEDVDMGMEEPDDYGSECLHICNNISDYDEDELNEEELRLLVGEGEIYV